MSKINSSIYELATQCRRTNCSWIHLEKLTGLQDVPPLRANPELSGIGVILGFSISAYLTLALLILHYITVHNIHRTNRKGKEYVNPVDRGILTFIRERVISWKPSKRFEYAMEKSVLIFSDLNLVTGLGILIAAYSQLACGISAYHWQIMVFVAWFASFSFVSAMTFLEGYFQTNNSMRIIRVFFMVVLATLLIAALLPTGSKKWLNQNLMDGDGFYPSLATACYYKLLGMRAFVRRGPKLWSMMFSILIVAFSYIHCGIRLFDPTAGTSRKYLRTWPGSKLKRLLHILEGKALHTGFQAYIWFGLYLPLYAGFTSIRALYDVSESMLLEIIWLTFAMAWGTIKVWETRSIALYNFDGQNFTANTLVLAENRWNFGQTLPLILLLLPLLSMAQAYLDNDAKAQEEIAEITRARHPSSTSRIFETRVENIADGMDEARQDHRNSTSRSAARYKHQAALHHARTCSTLTSSVCTDDLKPASQRSASDTITSLLPQHPYVHFTSYVWYRDHIFLLLCQILMLTAFSLWVLTELANIFGIAALLRNVVFLIWIFGMIPVASMAHLGAWYIAALIVSRWKGAEEWLKGETTHARRGETWRENTTTGKVVYWSLRIGLVGGCLMLTLFGSLELAGPQGLDYDV